MRQETSPLALDLLVRAGDFPAEIEEACRTYESLGLTVDIQRVVARMRLSGPIDEEEISQRVVTNSLHRRLHEKGLE